MSESFREEEVTPTHLSLREIHSINVANTTSESKDYSEDKQEEEEEEEEDKEEEEQTEQKELSEKEEQESASVMQKEDKTEEVINVSNSTSSHIVRTNIDESLNNLLNEDFDRIINEMTLTVAADCKITNADAKVSTTNANNNRNCQITGVNNIEDKNYPTKEVINIKIYEEMLQTTSIVALAQIIAKTLRENPELYGVLPVPVNVLEHCYSLALNAPVHTRKSSSLIALELCKQIRLLQPSCTITSTMQQATLDLQFATLHANACNWDEANNTITSSKVIDEQTRQSFLQSVQAQQVCENIIVKWERTPHSTSIEDVSYAVQHVADWNVAERLMRQYENYYHVVGQVRLALLTRGDVLANTSWQTHYKYFNKLPRNEQKYHVARTLIRRVPLSAEEYILVVSDVLQHTAQTISSATLAKWLYSAERRQNWCFAIALGCAARYYDVVLPFLQFIPCLPPSSRSTRPELRQTATQTFVENTNKINSSTDYQYHYHHHHHHHHKQQQYHQESRIMYILPIQFINYEKAVRKLQNANLNMHQLHNESHHRYCENLDYKTNMSISEAHCTECQEGEAELCTNIECKERELVEREQINMKCNNSSEHDKDNTNNDNKTEEKALSVTTRQNDLFSEQNMPFELCLAHALHGDWQKIIRNPCAMADRRLRALCNALILHKKQTKQSTFDATTNIFTTIVRVDTTNNNNDSNKAKTSNGDGDNDDSDTSQLLVKQTKGKECFYFHSAFFSQLVFHHARRSAQQRFLHAIPPTEYFHYTHNNYFNEFANSPIIQEHYAMPSLSYAEDKPFAFNITTNNACSAKYAYPYINVSSQNHLWYNEQYTLPTKISNQKECKQLFQFICQKVCYDRTRQNPHTQRNVDDITYWRLIAFALAQSGPTLFTDTKQSYVLPLQILKTVSVLQLQLEASITINLASVIPTPILDQHLDVIILVCESLLLLDKWQEVLSIYWRISHKQLTRAHHHNSFTSDNVEKRRQQQQQHQEQENYELYCSKLHEVVSKVAYYCHSSKKEYNKFIEQVKQNGKISRLTQIIFDLMHGNVEKVCHALREVERTRQVNARASTLNEQCGKTNTIHDYELPLQHKQQQQQQQQQEQQLILYEKAQEERREFVSAAFCLLHREADLRAVLKAISQTHVAAIDLNSHGLQRLLKVLPTSTAVEAVAEYAHEGKQTTHTHWITYLLSRHDVQTNEVHTLSSLQPYACDVHYVQTAVCALHGHDANNVFSNLYHFYFSSTLHSRLPRQFHQLFDVPVPTLRALALLLRSAVEDDTLLTQALTSHQVEIANMTNNNNNNDDKSSSNSSNSTNNSSHCSAHLAMRELYHKLQECKSLSLSFHGSHRLLRPALYYASSLHAMLLAGAMHYLLAKALQIPIPASFTSRLLRCSCSCGANVDWTVSWFFFNALRRPTRAERQIIVKALSSVNWTDKVDSVVSHTLLHSREFLFYEPEQVVVWANTHLGKQKWQVSLELSELFAAMESHSSSLTIKQEVTESSTNVKVSSFTTQDFTNTTSKTIYNDKENERVANEKSDNVDTKHTSWQDDKLVERDAFIFVEELIRKWAYHECVRALEALERVGHKSACDSENAASKGNHQDGNSINQATRRNKNKVEMRNSSKHVGKFHKSDKAAIECGKRVVEIIRKHQSVCFPPPKHDTPRSDNNDNSKNDASDCATSALTDKVSGTVQM